MDLISILNGLKDKVLDAKNFELLKHAYDLQNENIEQLKSNNDALKENNDLLKEQVKDLQKENESLKLRIENLSQKLAQVDYGSEVSRFSEVAIAILDLYQQHDTTGLWKESEIIPALSFSTIQVESAIDELKNAKMIRSTLIGSGGIKYSLTEQGKKYLAGNSK
jgi:cell division protein FtsB